MKNATKNINNKSSITNNDCVIISSDKLQELAESERWEVIVWWIERKSL